MILTPPFHLSGEAGKALPESGFLLSVLGVSAGELTFRSFDEDTLDFRLRAKPGTTLIPENDQWITLSDASGARCFTGKCKRTYHYATKTYIYTARNVYNALGNTPLTDEAGRPFVSYENMTLGEIVRAIIDRAQALGLPIQSSEETPDFHSAPKSAFRGATLGHALEEIVKWVPDVASRMDYSTEPPTLMVSSRTDSAAVVINLYEGQVVDITLEEDDSQRAKAISINYSERTTADTVEKKTQVAGDPDAEGARRLSVFLSGEERSDILASEALVKAEYAALIAQEVATATLTTVTALSSGPAVRFNWEWFVANNSALAAAAAAEAGFVMSSAVGIYWSYFRYSSHGQLASFAPIYIGDASQIPLKGWYAVAPGAFTEEQLELAGARSRTAYICGWLARSIFSQGLGAGAASLYASNPNQCATIFYDATRPRPSNVAPKIFLFRVFQAITVVDVRIDKIAAAVASYQAERYNKLPGRAEFAVPPDGLAENYFQRQDHTQIRGEILLKPGADVPMPGQFVNLMGDGLPPLWEVMAAPVAASRIDLFTREGFATVGPPARMNHARISDRLRIPQEDNYQAS